MQDGLVGGVPAPQAADNKGFYYCVVAPLPQGYCNRLALLQFSRSSPSGRPQVRFRKISWCRWWWLSYLCRLSPPRPVVGLFPQRSYLFTATVVPSDFSGSARAEASLRRSHNVDIFCPPRRIVLWHLTEYNLACRDEWNANQRILWHSHCIKSGYLPNRCWYLQHFPLVRLAQ